MKKVFIQLIPFLIFLGCKTSKTEHNEIKVEKFVEIDNKIRNRHLINCSIDVPETWFSYFGHHGLLHSPRKFQNNINIENTNFVYIYEGDLNNQTKIEKSKFIKEKIKKYKKQNPYFKHELIKGNHPLYGEFYFIKYKITNYKKESWIYLEAVITHNNKNFTIYYISKTEFYEEFLEDAINMILSFKIKE